MTSNCQDPDESANPLPRICACGEPATFELTHGTAEHDIGAFVCNNEKCQLDTMLLLHKKLCGFTRYRFLINQFACVEPLQQLILEHRTKGLIQGAESPFLDEFAEFMKKVAAFPAETSSVEETYKLVYELREHLIDSLIEVDLLERTRTSFVQSLIEGRG